MNSPAHVERNRGWSGDLAAVTVCIFAGAVMSALPHLIEWWRTGHAVWIADYDELDIYLPVASHAWHGNPWHLADPVCPGRDSYLPWLFINPAVILARLLGLPVIYIGFVRRLMAGAELGVVWYLIFRLYFSRRWIALSLALFALFDLGTMDGRPLVEQVAEFVRLWRLPPDRLLSYPDSPMTSGPWRIINPALSWPVLLIYIWTMGRAVKSGSRAATAWAAIGFGLCFSYFYYWTAVAGSLVIGAILDRTRRRTYLWTAGVGFLLGAPFILRGLILKGQGTADWLQRFDQFLPIGHFNELMFPKVVIIAMVLALPWIFLRRGDLLYLWALCVAALMVTNQQILTGLQMENKHWHYVWGPTAWLIVVLLIVDATILSPRWSRRLLPLGIGFLLFTIASGLWIRSLETTRSEQSVMLTKTWDSFADQPRPALRPGQVVAGMPELVSMFTISDDERPLAGYLARVSSCINDKEWNERIAADAYFSGLDREAFESREKGRLAADLWGRWGRNAAVRDAMLAERMADYDQVAGDPDATAERFDIRYVVLPTGSENNNLDRNWEQVVSGPVWLAWERR